MKNISSKILGVAILVILYPTQEVHGQQNLDLEIEVKLKKALNECGCVSEKDQKIVESILSDKREILPSLVKLTGKKYSYELRMTAFNYIEERGELGKDIVVEALAVYLQEELISYYEEYQKLENPEDLKKPLDGGILKYNQEITDEQLEAIAKLPPPDPSLRIVRDRAGDVRTTMSKLGKGRNPKALDILLQVMLEPKDILIGGYLKRDILNFATELGTEVHLEEIKKSRVKYADDEKFLKLLEDSILALEKRLEEEKKKDKR